MQVLFAHHQANFVICCDLLDDCAHYLIESRPFGIVGWRNEISTLVGYKLLRALLFTRTTRLIDRDRMAALISHKPHAGDIRLTITDKDDIANRHWAILVRKE